MNRFANIVKDINSLSELVLHCNSMSPECVENVCGPGEV